MRWSRSSRSWAWCPGGMDANLSGVDGLGMHRDRSLNAVVMALPAGLRYSKGMFEDMRHHAQSSLWEILDESQSSNFLESSVCVARQITKARPNLLLLLKRWGMLYGVHALW